jgi:hypothetical protein
MVSSNYLWDNPAAFSFKAQNNAGSSEAPVSFILKEEVWG